jgi:hypothetical protein
MKARTGLQRDADDCFRLLILLSVMVMTIFDHYGNTASVVILARLSVGLELALLRSRSTLTAQRDVCFLCSIESHHSSMRAIGLL